MKRTVIVIEDEGDLEASKQVGKAADGLESKRRKTDAEEEDDEEQTVPIGDPPTQTLDTIPIPPSDESIDGGEHRKDDGDAWLLSSGMSGDHATQKDEDEDEHTQEPLPRVPSKQGVPSKEPPPPRIPIGKSRSFVRPAPAPAPPLSPVKSASLGISAITENHEDERLRMTCCVCDADISAMDAVERQHHTNQCLDGLAEMKQKHQAEDDTQRPAAVVSKVYACELCGRDLTGLGIDARLRHIQKHKKEPGAQEKLRIEREKRAAAAAAKKDEDEADAPPLVRQNKSDPALVVAAVPASVITKPPPQQDESVRQSIKSPFFAGARAEEPSQRRRRKPSKQSTRKELEPQTEEDERLMLAQALSMTTDQPSPRKDLAGFPIVPSPPSKQILGLRANAEELFVEPKKDEKDLLPTPQFSRSSLQRALAAGGSPSSMWNEASKGLPTPPEEKVSQSSSLPASGQPPDDLGSLSGQPVVPPHYLLGNPSPDAMGSPFKPSVPSSSTTEVARKDAEIQTVAEPAIGREIIERIIGECKGACKAMIEEAKKTIASDVMKEIDEAKKRALQEITEAVTAAETSRSATGQSGALSGDIMSDDTDTQRVYDLLREIEQDQPRRGNGMAITPALSKPALPVASVPPPPSQPVVVVSAPPIALHRRPPVMAIRKPPEQMTEEELKAAVKSFGVRPQSKAAMIEFLNRVQGQSQGQNEGASATQEPPLSQSTQAQSSKRDEIFSQILKSERPLHEKIISFQTVSARECLAMIQDKGVSCTMTELKAFLAAQGISFT